MTRAVAVVGIGWSGDLPQKIVQHLAPGVTPTAGTGAWYRAGWMA